MTQSLLSADCSQCAALCCMTFEFEVSDDFAISKPANTACRNLDECGDCKVHDTLEDLGFRGCAVFECYGAGQRVTQDMFGGRTWQDDPSLIPLMAERFRQVRRLHELLMLLEAGAVLALPQVDEAQRVSWAERVDMLVSADASDEEIDAVSKEVHGFLRSLQRHVGQR
ncbi:MAG: hypothetical protein P1U69_09930 [Parvibaculaceae bacterium]|nr:hypothetical protein [Parvibaculaceae bacterium]